MLIVSRFMLTNVLRFGILGIRNEECAYLFEKLGRQLDPKQLVADKLGRERGKYVGRFYVPKYR